MSRPSPTTSFPILTLEGVRAAIADRPEFIEADKGDYIVFNYMVAHEDSFDCDIRRECRGLIFSKEGKVISRRFHKFFNLGEKEFTQAANVDWNRPHAVLEKLDGSMITPLMLGNILHWATKMGVTDVSAKAEAFVEKNPNYAYFATKCIGAGYTPIFEFISPDNRIVMPYTEPNLILLAIRCNTTGEYILPGLMASFADPFNIPVVQEYKGSLDDLKDQIGMEGVVVRFYDGHMIKIKTEWYVAIHKAKENILHEKNVIKLILEEKLDDIVANLPDDDKKRLLDYKEALTGAIDRYEKFLHGILMSAHGMDRKTFALDVAAGLDSFTKPIAFSSLDKPEGLRENIRLAILKRTGSQAQVDSIPILTVRWHPMGDFS